MNLKVFMIFYVNYHSIRSESFMCRENPYNELFYTMLNSTERIANQFQHICIQKVKHLVGLEIKIINSFAVHAMSWLQSFQKSPFWILNIQFHNSDFLGWFWISKQFGRFNSRINWWWKWTPKSNQVQNRSWKQNLAVSLRFRGNEIVKIKFTIYEMCAFFPHRKKCARKYERNSHNFSASINSGTILHWMVICQVNSSRILALLRTSSISKLF